MTPPAASACPCGSARAYAACCQPLHEGHAAATAEALMRSRYSAYVLRLAPYLIQSWHPRTRPDQVDFGHASEQPAWLGLDVRRHESTGADSALVEFIARFRLGGASAQRLHEISHFVREQGRWYYQRGDLQS